MSARTILFWLDFEATGLDVRPGFGEVIEYAAVFTDLELKEYTSCEGVIPHNMNYLDPLFSEKAREMHVKNGLLEELRAAEKTAKCVGVPAVAEVEDKLIAILKFFMAQEPTIFVIAGSSIWYDRNCLKEHMPRLEKMLHYRQLDVSVYKVGFPSIFGSDTSTAHRAMADIRESIKKHELMRKIVNGRAELIRSSLELLDNASVYDTDDDGEVVEISEPDFTEFERAVRRNQK